MGGIQDAVLKASRRQTIKTIRTTATLPPHISIAVITLEISGSGMGESTSPWFDFGGAFITEPAGGILQENTTDGSGNPVILQTTVSYSQSGGLYQSACIHVFSLQDVGSYTTKIHAVFMGRGYAT